MYIFLSQTNNSVDLLDAIFKFATISIAAFNLFFVIKLFNIKTHKDDLEKEHDRKISLLKTLVLDHSLKNFYEIVDQISTVSQKLKQDGLSDNNKIDIDGEIGDLFIKLRRSFYDSLLGIDESLYERIKKHCDDLQSHFAKTIFDRGINLTYQPKYDEKINEKIVASKTEIIKLLFSYRGS